MMRFTILFVIAFCVGAIPTAYIFVRLLGGGDIREKGSGNVGATNAARVLGRKWGLLIFALDFLKGFLPAFFLARWAGPLLHLSLPELAELVGFGAILGHIFTPFLGGKGGKGIATGAGVICAGYPLIFSLMMLVWVAFFFLSRKTVSLASLGAVASFIPFSILFSFPLFTKAYAIILLLLVLWTHKSNISRLLKGQEIKSS